MESRYLRDEKVSLTNFSRLNILHKEQILIEYYNTSQFHKEEVIERNFYLERFRSKGMNKKYKLACKYLKRIERHFFHGRMNPVRTITRF